MNWEAHFRALDIVIRYIRSSHSQMFFKIGVLKNFSIFTGKHPYWSLLCLCWSLLCWIELLEWKSATLLYSGCSAAYPYGCSIRKLKNNFLKFSIKKILKFHWRQLCRKFFFKKLQVLHDLRQMKHYEEVVTLTCSEKYRRLWHSCFPVDFAKFSRTYFLQKNSGQKQPLEVFCKKRCSFKFRKIQLCQSLFFNKVAGLRPATLLKKRLRHRCFAANFSKFVRTPFS